MIIDTFSNRLNTAMKLRNMRQVDLVKKTKLIMEELIKDYKGDGIDKTLLNKYINGVAKAKSDNIYILAKALDVNEAWLMGYDTTMDRIPDNQRTDELLQYKISKLSDTQKEAIINIIDNMK